MPTTMLNTYPLARRVHAWLHWLHLDALLPGVLLLALLAFSGASPRNLPQPEVSVLTSVPGGSMTVPATAAPTAGPLPLHPEMRAALDFVARRYRVSAEAIGPAFHAAQFAAQERGLDPLLIIAVISIESRFNPFTQSPMGAKGLMQIIPRYHRDKIPDEASPHPLFDPVLNVRIGTRILHEYIQRQGGVSEGLQYYNGASDDEEQLYANKVLAEKRLLEQAARARV